jgi:lysophospholipase L1-like esterase
MSTIVAQEDDELVVVAFGASTTALRKNIDKIYPVRLQEHLTQAGIRNQVINSGIPGSHTGSINDNNRFKIAHGMDRFDTAVLHYHPDWLVINLGINDSWQDAGRKDTSRIALNKYRYNLSYFIDAILQQGGKVILLTPNPIGEKYKGFHERRLKKYVRVTRQLGRNKKIALIDTWVLFNHFVRKQKTGLDSLFLDAMHPNDTGHRLISDHHC